MLLYAVDLLMKTDPIFYFCYSHLLTYHWRVMPTVNCHIAHINYVR